MRRLACLLLLLVGARADGPADDTAALLADLDAEVLARKEGGRGDDALALEAEILALRERAAGAGPPRPSEKPEAHLVVLSGTPASRDVSVRVSLPGRPVVLVLVSEAAVRWRLDVAKGVELSRVCTAGYAEVPVRGLPAGCRVETLADYGGLVAAPDMARNVETRVRSLVKTHLSVDAIGAGPIVVGPENPAWQAQHVHADALELWWRSTRGRRAAERELRKAERFGALYRWRTDETLHASFGDWTPLGPLLARQAPLADVLAVATAAVEDEERREIYLLRHGALIRYALPKGPPEVLNVPDTLPQVRERCALAVDTRRKRLLLATKHDHGYLYALDLASRNWSVLNHLDDVRASAMAYDAQRDAILCVEYGKDGALRLHRFSPEDGKHQREITLRVPPLAEKRPLAAACVGGHLLLLYPPAEPHRDAEETRAFVVEPHSGDVVFSTRVRPWEDFAPLGKIELEELWSELALADEARAGRAMRALAGQGDRAVEFLALRFSPEPGAVEDLAGWIDRLADDDALVRDLAQHRLLEAGPRAEVFLAELHEEDLPPEARRRIAAVLKAIGGPGRLQRALRAIRVLEWIESPAAEALLRGLARRGDAQRANAAADAVSRIERPRR